jgi:hypothetical protein
MLLSRGNGGHRLNQITCLQDHALTTLDPQKFGYAPQPHAVQVSRRFRRYSVVEPMCGPGSHTTTDRLSTVQQYADAAYMPETAPAAVVAPGYASLGYLSAVQSIAPDLYDDMHGEPPSYPFP